MALLKFNKQQQTKKTDDLVDWVDPVARGRGGLRTTRVPVKFDLETLDLIDSERGALTRSQYIRRAVDMEIGGAHG